MISIRTQGHNKGIVDPPRPEAGSVYHNGAADQPEQRLVPPSFAPGDTTVPSRDDGGDIIYGSWAIARYLFPDAFKVKPVPTRRRVFTLWAHYKQFKEPGKRAGFFKLGGTLCLSKSQWRRFHGWS